MKILQISKYYFPYLGGVENICKFIVDGMKHHLMRVVCFDEGTKNIKDIVNEVDVVRIGTLFTLARQAFSFSYFRILKRQIKYFSPDIVHFHWANPYPAFVLLCVLPKHVKLVVHWHMDIVKQAKLYPLVKPIETRLLKRADMVVVTSPQYKEGSIPLQPFKDKVRIVPNAIDEKMFEKHQNDAEKIEVIKQKYGNKKLIFFIGRHIQYKGLPYLIDAEKYIKSDCEIVIAGSGPLTNQLKKQCSSNRVHFVGRLTDEELRLYHYAADIFAFPSISKNEAFGVALAEGMYCGTPAVTFTIPGSGVNWVNLNNETGIEVPNGDVKAYANAIDTLLTDDQLRLKYAEAAHQRVCNNFLMKHMTSAMDLVYEEVMGVKS